MKTVVGKVIQINLDTQVAKKDGGSYPGWQLIFSDPNGKVETVAKHKSSLTRSPAVGSGLKSLSAGDDFTMEMEKGDAGFWEVVSIRKGSDLPATKSEGQVRAVSNTRSAPSTYETTEERSLRQVLIVRQSSVAQAIAATPGGELKTILKTAEKIEDHVWRGYEIKKAAVPVTTDSAPEVE